MSNDPLTYGAIFDVDGTLVDSYDAHFQSWQEALSKYDITYGHDEFARNFGRRNPEIITEIYEDRGLTCPSDDAMQRIADEKEACFRGIIARDFPMMPGADALLQQLHAAGWQLAMGSSAPRANVALSIDRLGVEPLLGGVAAGEDVTRGKPHPDVFLHAASLLNLKPEQCIVIEDAAPGIEAAHRAGMPAAVIASQGRTHDELADAEHIVDSLTELNPDLLARLIKEYSK